MLAPLPRHLHHRWPAPAPAPFARPSRAPRALTHGRPPATRPPPRTKWTRRVPHPVLIGHAAVPGALQRGPNARVRRGAGRACARARGVARAPRRRRRGRRHWSGPVHTGRQHRRALRGARARARGGGARTRAAFPVFAHGRRPAHPRPRRVPSAPPPPCPPLVLSGHAASLTPYYSDTPRPSPRTNRTRRVRRKQARSARSLRRARSARCASPRRCWCSRLRRPPPPLPLRTHRTRRVLRPVLIGHAASLTPCSSRRARRPRATSRRPARSSTSSRCAPTPPPCPATSAPPKCV